MLTPILIGLAVVIVLFIIVVAMRPADFRVIRSATMDAPAAAIFAQVNHFHKWEAWSPWAKIDPNAKNTYSGPASGVGAGFMWSGNSQVGEGRMTITGSIPNELISIRLEFLRPFKATNAAEFAFQPEGGRTVVTWSMSGKNNFMSKAFGLFMNCNKMIGGQFEKGLAQMNVAAQAESR